MPKDSDEWGNGKTLGEMRRLCPDPSLTAHERNNPIELAAVEAGFRGWDAWAVFDGNYYDDESYVHLSPHTNAKGGWELSWPGEEPGDPLFSQESMIESMRRFCAAFLKVTSDSPTSSSNWTVVVAKRA